MKTRNAVVILCFGLFLISCAKPVYQCGQPKPEKNLRLSKRVQAVVDERDNLCNTLSLRDNEIGKLKKNINSLNEEIAELNKEVSDLNGSLKITEKKYHDLSDASLNQAQQLNLSLKQKSDELYEKERLLQEREKTLYDLQLVIARKDSITNRLNEVLRNALLGFRSDELSVEIINGKVYVSMSDKLLFKSGSASIEAKGKDAIKLLADVLDKNKDIDILVEGHTDNIPIKTAVYRDNWDLSVARATSIVRILTDEYRILPTRVTASGKGEFSPKVSNETPEGRAGNRRTEIILSPKLEEIMNLLKPS